MDIHVRLKLLIWRITLNLLPTKVSLNWFAPELDTTCIICGEQPESIIYLLWYCSLARVLWFNNKWGIRTNLFNFDSLRQLIGALLVPSPLLELTKSKANNFFLGGALICDQVCKLRNAMVHEKGLINLDLLPSTLKCREIEHQSSYGLHSRPPPPAMQQVWRKPGVGWFKINVDAVDCCIQLLFLCGCCLSWLERDRGISYFLKSLHLYPSSGWSKGHPVGCSSSRRAGVRTSHFLEWFKDLHQCSFWYFTWFLLEDSKSYLPDSSAILKSSFLVILLNQAWSQGCIS